MSLEGRVEKLEEVAGIVPGSKPLEQWTDAELCDVIWPDGRWRAWTDAELDSQLRLQIAASIRGKTDDELREIIAQGKA